MIPGGGKLRLVTGRSAMQKRAAVIIFIMLGVTGSAGAAASMQGAGDWVEVFSRQRGVVLIDRNSIRRGGDQVIATSEARFRQPEEDGTFRHRTRWSYDCRGRSAVLLSYRMERADGSIIEQGEVAPNNRERQQISEDTPNHAIIGYLCR
jgi:hypothetical protein